MSKVAKSIRKLTIREEFSKLGNKIRGYSPIVQFAWYLFTATVIAILGTFIIDGLKTLMITQQIENTWYCLMAQWLCVIILCSWVCWFVHKAFVFLGSRIWIGKE